MAAKKKKSALAEAASRRLMAIGLPKLTPHDIAHAMFHAEERGEVERVPSDDAPGWAWLLPAQGSAARQRIQPTPEMLESLTQLAAGIGHGHA
jgi:hypothetical protein